MVYNSVNKAMFLVSVLNFYIHIYMSGKQLTLLSKGCNSEIMLFGSGDDSVVLKVVSNLNRKEAKHLRNECEILNSLKHPHIVRSLKFQDNLCFHGNEMTTQKRQSKSALVLEYAEEGSLLQYLKKNKLKIGSIRKHFIDICYAVHHLHQKQIAHRDLKLQNLLVFKQDDQAIVKISDFGFASRLQKNQKVREHKGTRKGYMAPEIYQILIDANSTYDPIKSDIFSLGVILFALILNKLPFEYSKAQDKIYKMIRQEKWQNFWQFHQNSTKWVLDCQNLMWQDFKILFQKMVCQCPQNRWNINEILGSEWVKGKLY